MKRIFKVKKISKNNYILFLKLGLASLTNFDMAVHYMPLLNKVINLL